MIPRWLVQLLAVALKEVRHTVRDRRIMAMLLVAPVVQLGVFGAAVDFDVDRVPTVILDQDRSVTSRAHLERIFADGVLLPRWTAHSEAEVRALIDRGDAAVAVIVPPRFGRELGRGRRAHLQVLVDGTDPNRGATAAAAVARYARSETRVMVRQFLQERRDAAGAGLGHGSALGGGRGEVVLVPRVLYNPRLRTATYMVPGIIALLLVVVTVIVTAMGLARERETGTMEQMLVTPLPPIVLLSGKLLPYLFIGLFDFSLAVAVATWVFDVPISGPLTVALLGTAAYLVCTLGIGLLISTLSRTQQQAFIGGFLFMLPAILLSGIMTPLYGVPWWLQPLVAINPVRYYGEVVRGVLLRGATFSDVRSEIATLGVIGTSVLLVAARRFKRSLA